MEYKIMNLGIKNYLFGSFHYILLFFIAIFGIWFVMRMVLPTREGFQTYQQCIDSGFTKEFCVQTPSSVFGLGPGTCMCDDGTIGRYLPGFRGQCVCGM
jgi:hypothetical protein